MALPRESAYERVVREWTPVLGHRYAAMKAAAIRPVARGLLGVVLLGAIATVIPFFFRFSPVGIALEVVLLIAAVTWLYLGMWPMFRVAKVLLANFAMPESQ